MTTKRTPSPPTTTEPPATEPPALYADRVLHEAMLSATGGLDPGQAHTVAANILAALDKQAAALKAADYQPGDYEKISRAMAHAMKSADGLLRLVEFVSGRPDSRPDKGSDWLRMLSNEQLDIVEGWIKASIGGGADEPPGGRR